MQYTEHKNPSHTDMWYCEQGGEKPELRCVWTVLDCIFPLIRWSKTGPQRDSHWDERCEECRGGWREPMIGMGGLGLHVQLSSRQGEEGAGVEN